MPTMFSPRCFVNAGYEMAHGEWRAKDRALIQAIRSALPELIEWGDLPAGIAWGDYSQDVWLLSWLEGTQHSLDRKGLIPFLAYVHYRDKNGRIPKCGITLEGLNAYAAANSLS